ncbi:hypothetical protein ACLMAB_07265 [Brevibacillus laterosporus]
MGRVTNNSEGDETKNISKLMKEITEQTNLLGLNVAIEGVFRLLGVQQLVYIPVVERQAVKEGSSEEERL